MGHAGFCVKLSVVDSRRIRWTLLTLEEESGLVGDEIAGEVLRCIHQACDGRSPQIGAFEQVEEGWVAVEFRFDLHSASNHGQFLLVILCLVSKTLKRFEGFGRAAFSGEPPWRLRCEEDQDQEWRLHLSAPA